MQIIHFNVGDKVLLKKSTPAPPTFLKLRAEEATFALFVINAHVILLFRVKNLKK